MIFSYADLSRKADSDRVNRHFRQTSGRARLFLCRLVLVAPVFSLFMLLATPANAYIGPGAGLSAIGSTLALIGAVCLAIVGFIWYPVKRLSRWLLGKPGSKGSTSDDDFPDGSSP